MVCWVAYRGHAVCTGAAVIGGKHLASRISERTVRSPSLDHIHVLDLQHIPNLTGGQVIFLCPSHWPVTIFNLHPLMQTQTCTCPWCLPSTKKAQLHEWRIVYSISLDRTMSYKCGGYIWITHWSWIFQEGWVTQVLPPLLFKTLQDTLHARLLSLDSFLHSSIAF